MRATINFKDIEWEKIGTHAKNLGMSASTLVRIAVRMMNKNLTRRHYTLSQLVKEFKEVKQ